MVEGNARSLRSTFLRVRADESVEELPVDATFWPRLIGGQLGDFRGEQLVTALTFDADWTNWEMHPKGDEVLCLLSGDVEFLFEKPGGVEHVRLTAPTDYVIVPRGVWHTARVHAPARMVAITPGEGTQHRPRS